MTKEKCIEPTIILLLPHNKTQGFKRSLLTILSTIKQKTINITVSFRYIHLKINIFRLFLHKNF